MIRFLKIKIVREKLQFLFTFNISSGGMNEWDRIIRGCQDSWEYPFTYLGYVCHDAHGKTENKIIRNKSNYNKLRLQQS